MNPRLDTAWLLACFVLGLALVVWLGRRMGGGRATASAPRDASPLDPPDDDGPEPVCRTRGCTASATRGLPELVQRRALAALVPSWVVVDDPEADVALCRAHHAVWTAHLRRLAVAESAALEEHLAAQHQRLVATVAADLPKTLQLAPPAVPLRPSPLRGTTVPPLAGPPAPPPVETPDAAPS